MPSPATRQPTTLATQIPGGFTRPENRQLQRQQNAEIARGVIAATRVQSAALTATVGIQCVGMLSREAQFQSDGDPAVMNRLNHIVDQFACFVGAEVARFGF